jgi:RNA polymerase sigma factor (sigma-70 family)
MDQLAATSPNLPGTDAAPAAVVPFPDSGGSKPPPNLAVLFQAEESGLLRYAISLVGRRSVAEELVQETFLRLHQLWGQVENPRAWLYRSLRNLAFNYRRDHPLQREGELNEQQLPGGEAPLPAERLEHDEALGTVQLLLAELPPEDRDLVRLKYHDGLKYDEIARRTGLSSGNVGYRLHHVLKGLAVALRRAGIHGSRG